MLPTAFSLYQAPDLNLPAVINMRCDASLGPDVWENRICINAIDLITTDSLISCWARASSDRIHMILSCGKRVLGESIVPLKYISGHNATIWTWFSGSEIRFIDSWKTEIDGTISNCVVRAITWQLLIALVFCFRFFMLRLFYLLMVY